MKQEPLNFILAQVNPIVGAVFGNRDLVSSVWASVPDDADLLVFPEMVLSGYPAEDLVLRPSFMDAIANAVEDLCVISRDKSSGLLLPTPWREDDGRIFNAVLLIHDGKVQAVRHKYELPNYGVFDEKRIFSQGELPAPIAFKGTSLGVMICEDMWHKTVSAHLKEQGAEVFVIVNGSPFVIDKQDERLELAKLRVQENQLPLLYVNLVGGQDELVFDGGSFVMQPNGQVVHVMERFQEGLYMASMPFDDEPADIDPVLPQELAYKAVTLGLRDYVVKNDFPGVIIGMSGGIDSAICAAIAVDALGPENVRLVMMPSPYTSQDSLDDAKQCAEALGATYEIMNIVPAMTAFEQVIPDLSGLAHENMQSRVRGNILMSLSNESGAMVITTGNKSEVAVGYATLYGDMCGGYNPIKDLYKMQVYALAQWRNEIEGEELIPSNIIDKAPSAELRPDQKDEDNLPSYTVLDDILECLIEEEMSIDDIVAKDHERDTVVRVMNLLDIAEYKRRQAAPGAIVSSKAFGRDRRYPITNGFRKDVTRTS